MGAKLSRAYARLLEACGLAAGCIVAALALLISVDIGARNLGLFNFPWLLEVSEYSLYIATFLAAPWVLYLGAHVRVDVLIEVLPRRAAYWLAITTDCIGGGVALVLGYYGWRATTDAFRLGSRVAKELVVAEWCLLAVIPVCAALLAVEFGCRVGRGLRAGPGSAGADRAVGAL